MELSLCYLNLLFKNDIKCVILFTVVIVMNVYNDFPKNMLFDKELNEEELELIKSEYKKLQCCQ